MKMASSVLASALLVAFAHCGDAAAADAPVSEAGGANRHRNEPDGFTKLADTSFGRMTEGGFIASRRNKLGSIVQDPTAPRSSGNVYRMTYTKGKHDGEGGVNRLWSPSIRGGARRMYVHTWWKVSKNWIGHPSGVNKVFYLSDRKHSIIVAIAGGGRGPLGVRVIPQGSLKSASFRAPGVIKRGKWHEWELLLEAPGQGQPNVQLDIWIDGKKVLDIEMQPRDPSLDLRWTHLNLDPIWGGRHGELPEEQYQCCDHMYISYSKSGSSRSGGRSAESTGPDKSLFAADGATIHPNEPEGLAKFLETRFDSKTEGGFIPDKRNRAPNVVQDQNAPHSPPNVYRMVYAKGKHDGEGSPQRMWSRHFPGRAKEMYLHTWWKISENWVGHPSGVNKMFFIAVGKRTTGVVVEAGGSGRGKLQVRVVTQGNLKSANYYANMNKSAAVLERGKWHEWEILLRAPEPGEKNAELHIWIDRTKVVESPMPVVDPEADNLVSHLNLDPIWGGRGGQLPEEQYFYCDYMYLSYEKAGMAKSTRFEVPGKSAGNGSSGSRSLVPAVPSQVPSAPPNCGDREQQDGREIG